LHVTIVVSSGLGKVCARNFFILSAHLTLILLTWRIWWASNNAQQMADGI